MEYCFTTNFDLLEVTKLLSPWLLALLVYKVWHFQKEKEVVANEAKDILKIIDNLKSSYTAVYINYYMYYKNNSYFNINEFENYKNENHKIEKDFISKISFLLALIEDEVLKKIYDNFELNKAKFSATQMIYEDGDIKILDDLKIITDWLEKDLDDFKLVLVKYAMYKNKIYSKSA
jgi:hypothetical protein